MQHCCTQDITICSIQDFTKIDDLLYAIKESSTNLTEKKYKNMVYGYGCAEGIDKDLKKLNQFNQTLNRLKKTYYNNGSSSCLSAENIQNIIEKVQVFVGKSVCRGDRLDINIDESNLDLYLFNNPQCVSFEEWERFAVTSCDNLEFKLELVQEKCDVMFQISRKILSCDILYSLKVWEDLCNTGYTVSRTEDECKIDYTLLLENTNCDMSFRLYNRLIKEANLSYTLMETIYKAGNSLKIQNGQVFIVTSMGIYNLKNITPSNIKVLSELGLKFTVTKNNILRDYK